MKATAAVACVALLAGASLLSPLGGVANALHADEPAAPQPREVKSERGVIRLLDGQETTGAEADDLHNACRTQSSVPAPGSATSAFLKRKALFDVDRMKLGDFVKALSDLGGVRVKLDRTALGAININEDSPVSLSVTSITLRSALKHVLRLLDPTMRCVEQEAEVLITTSIEAQGFLDSKAYNVRELVAHTPPQHRIQHVWAETLQPEEYWRESLIDLIQRVESPASWDAEGGNGSIHPVGVGVLVVSQTADIQVRVAELLEVVCSVRNSQRERATAVPPARAVVNREEQVFAEQVEKAMGERVTFDFNRTALDEVLMKLSRASGLTLMLDKTALEAINITIDSPVTTNVHDLPLRAALEQILRSLDPTTTWTVGDEVVLITTREESQEHLRVVVYPVRDLTDPDPASGLCVIDPDALCEVVTSLIEPASWDEEGGPGACKFYGICDGLVVSQVGPVQARVAALLDEIRGTRRLGLAPRPDSQSAPMTTSVTATAPDAMQVVIYHLAITKTQAAKSAAAPVKTTNVAVPGVKSQMAGGGLRTFIGVMPEQDLGELKSAIVEITGVSNWPEGASIRAIGDQLLIRQTPDMHRQIHELLNALNVLRSDQVPYIGGMSNVVGFHPPSFFKEYGYEGV